MMDLVETSSHTGIVYDILSQRSGVAVDVIAAQPEMRLSEDLGLQSLDAADLLVVLEEQLGIEIEIADLAEIETVAAVTTLVSRRARSRQQTLGGAPQ